MELARHAGLKILWPQGREGSTPSSGTLLMKKLSRSKKLLAYIIGLALGDGNLSNPNGRAVRLRITCDTKYPMLIEHIKTSLRQLLPENMVSTINREKNGCVDISCYSNMWESILGWRYNRGPKYEQKVKIPNWVKESKSLTKECLRGLLQTDGSIYSDRGYSMINFVSYIPSLAQDVFSSIEELGYKPNMQELCYENGKTKYTIRISRNTRNFIQEIGLWKK